VLWARFAFQLGTLNDKRQLIIALLAPLLAWIPSAYTADSSQPTAEHAIAMHGTVKYGPDFKHFDYVNPDAL